MQRKIALQPATDSQIDQPIIDVTPEPADEFSLRDLLDRLRRRWGVMVAIVSAALVVTSLFLVFVTPTYSARGQLLIDNRANQVTNINSVVSTPGVELNDVPNEVEILKSRILAFLVIDQLGLEGDPEFNPVEKAKILESGSVWDKAKANVESEIKNVFTLTEGDLKKSKEASKNADAMALGAGADQYVAQMDPVRANINDRFLENLTVESGKRTRVVDVEFESTDPVKAAHVVNELMRIYLANQVEYQKRGVQKATERLEKIVNELKDEVQMAEASVQNFRAKSRLVDAKGTNVTAQQLGELNSRLVQAHAEEAASSARLSQVSRLVKVPGSMASAPDVLSSPLIQRLREKEVDLQRERSDLASRYGRKHPKMIKVDAERRNLRSKINEEINKIVEGLSNEVAVNRARMSALKRGLTTLETKAIDINKAEIRLRELEREATSKRQLHQTFLVRYRETSARLGMIEPTARIVSYAEPPQFPSFPKKARTFALATMLSALLAVLAALTLEGLRRNFETTEELESITGYRCLGVLPKTTRQLAMLKGSEYLRLMNPYSRLNQAIQNIRSTLYLANDSRHPKTLLVTSALPREGKTTFAMWYAGFCASSGQKVILLDCDLDRPKIHTMMDVPNDLGFSNVLSEDMELKSVIRTNTKMGIDFITAGETRTNGAKALDSVKVKDILESLSWDYDLIIIDSAPVLALTDAHIIARLVDSTVFVTQWRRTRRDLAISAARRLESVDVTSLSGFVLSQVNPRKSAGAIGYVPYTKGDERMVGSLRRWLGGAKRRDHDPVGTPRLGT